MRGLVIAAAIAAGAALCTAYAAYCGIFWWNQEAFIFPVPTWTDRERLTAEADERGIEQVDLVAEDGTRLLGWHHRTGADRLVLFFSGNGEAMSDYLPVHELLVAEGWDTFTVAWRGYPGSDGAPSQAGLALDARAAWTWATEHFPSNRVVVHGRSLGGAVAVELVDGLTPAPAGLVLESTFTRMGAVISRQAPGLPLFLLLRHPFRTDLHAPNLRLPTLVLYSTDDQLIPPDIGGRALAAAIPGAKAVETHGWSHQDDLPLSDTVARAAWLAFLDQQVPVDR